MIRTPKITNIVIKGILCNLLRRRNKMIREMIVMPRVMILNCWKVNFKISRGFVSALASELAKNAWIFSIESGKN